MQINTATHKITLRNHFLLRVCATVLAKGHMLYCEITKENKKKSCKWAIGYIIKNKRKTELMLVRSKSGSGHVTPFEG